MTAPYTPLLALWTHKVGLAMFAPSPIFHEWAGQNYMGRHCAETLIPHWHPDWRPGRFYR